MPHLKPVGLQSTNWIVRFVLIVAYESLGPAPSVLSMIHYCPYGASPHKILQLRKLTEDCFAAERRQLKWEAGAFRYPNKKGKALVKIISAYHRGVHILRHNVTTVPEARLCVNSSQYLNSLSPSS